MVDKKNCIEGASEKKWIFHTRFIFMYLDKPPQILVPSLKMNGISISGG